MSYLKLNIVFAIIFLFSCSQEEVVESVEWGKITWGVGNGDNGGCLGIFGYHGIPDFICIDWEDSGDYSEEYIIFYSDEEDGNYVELARTSETEYRNYDLDFGKSYYFYIIPNSSEYGEGPRSEIHSSIRSQKVKSTIFIELSEDFIVDFDVSATMMVLLASDFEANITFYIIDSATGNLISSFTNRSENPNKVFVNSKNEIIFSSSKAIFKFDPDTNQITHRLASDIHIDNIDVNKSNNRIYLTKSGSNQMEVYNSELELEAQFDLHTGFNETRNFTVGDDNKIYVSVIDGLTEAGGNQHFVYVLDADGILLKTYDNNSFFFSELAQVDNSGNLYVLGSGISSNYFMYKYQLKDSKISFIANFGEIMYGDEIFKVAPNGTVYKTTHFTIPLLIYKVTPDE